MKTENWLIDYCKSPDGYYNALLKYAIQFDKIRLLRRLTSYKLSNKALEHIYINIRSGGNKWTLTILYVKLMIIRNCLTNSGIQLYCYICKSGGIGKRYTGATRDINVWEMCSYIRPHGINLTSDCRFESCFLQIRRSPR